MLNLEGKSCQLKQNDLEVEMEKLTNYAVTI